MNDGGVCGGDLPPLLGDVLTGSDLTLEQAVERLEQGDPLEQLTAIQRRIVEDFAARS
jgi:hypothetical protein